MRVDSTVVINVNFMQYIRVVVPTFFLMKGDSCRTVTDGDKNDLLQLAILLWIAFINSLLRDRKYC